MVNNNEDQFAVVHQLLTHKFSKTSELQDIADLASQLCQKQVSFITLLDENTCWCRVKSGIDLESMPAETSFCRLGIEQDSLLIIPDLTKNQRFCNHTIVISEPYLRFYAGAPLILSNGLKIGTLCLFDALPGNLTEVQKKTLLVLSRQVAFLMELELSDDLLTQRLAVTEAKNDFIFRIEKLQSHQNQQSPLILNGFDNLTKDGYNEVDYDWLKMFNTVSDKFDKTIHDIVVESMESKDLNMIIFNKIVMEIEEYSILLLDKYGNIENGNKGAEKMKGYKSVEIVGLNFSIFYPEEDQINDKPAFLIQQAEVYDYVKHDGWLVRKDGTKFWGHIFIAAIHDYKGELIGFTNIMRDLTDIVVSKNLLLNTNDLLKQSKVIAGYGSYYIDLLINKWSSCDVLDKMFGIDCNYNRTLQGWYDIVYQDDKDMLSSYANETLKMKLPFDKEYRIKNAQTNEIVWVRGQGKFMLDSEGNVMGMLGNIFNISKQKLAEIERDIMIVDITNRNKDLEQFSYIVSHNLRAPLANIIGISLGLKENRFKMNETEIFVNGLFDSAIKLDDVIRDLNNILQVRNQSNEKKELVKFSEILSGIIISIGNLFKTTNAKLITNFSAIGEMYSLKSFLYSIFYNLILNSIKFQKKNINPVIEITSHKTENTIEIIFKDNGIGIDMKIYKAQVFGLYRRFHKHTEGNGIGLYMVKTQVESLGGEIFIESVVNEGTEFRIVFYDINK